MLEENFGPSTIASMPLETMSAAPQDTNGVIYCRRCGHSGCDVKIISCGCSMHSRCINVINPPLNQCPHCLTPVSGLALYPMSFQEIDRARQKEATQKSSKRGKKRKEPGGGYDDGGDNECRTGRWTPEEMAFCDKLIETFKTGELPVTNGVKLNDFLATMLKSKQSRLTKKMKNANLSGKIFKISTGYISNIEACKKFSEIEDAFLRSLNDPKEQASVRFHMQKEWREMFSSFCVSQNQALDADAWLSSVEEMEKRESLAKDAARMARRKMMMGIALNQDAQNPDQGVFIERNGNNDVSTGTYDNFCLDHEDLFSILSDKPYSGGANIKGRPMQLAGERHYWHYSSPFLGKVISYIQRHGCPFEHVDVWVPSFVPDNEASEGSGSNNISTCRLCFAGSATADVQIPPDGVSPAQMLSQDEQFHLLSFGDYSQKFSFNVGCGLPGRVYENGVPAWEQSVHNAPHHHFERCGGAIQWGIKTVVGIPIPSPNVGRIVVVVYSKHDRNKDQELVGRLYDEFKKMVPSPKWKLVVDIGKPNTAAIQSPGQRSISAPNVQEPSAGNGNLNVKTNGNASVGSDAQNGAGKDSRIDELVALLGEQMPHDPNSPYASYLQNFMSLRLMLLKPTRSAEEKEVEGTLLSSFSSYKSSGRDKGDIAVMIARDYMFLKQQHQPPARAQAQPQAQPLRPAPAASNSGFYHGNQAVVAQPYGAQQVGMDASSHSLPPQGLHQQHQQPVAMDASNHSVVALNQQVAESNDQLHHAQGGMPEVSNHSHIQLGHPPSAMHPAASYPGSNAQG